MEILKRKVYEPRPSEIAAALAPLATKPFLPGNVDIAVFYGGHSDKADFEELMPYFSGVDVFVPEITCWSMEMIRLFSRISRGDKSARKELERSHADGKFTPFADFETKSILGTGVRITPMDYSETHERAKEIHDHYENWGLLDKVVPDFNKTLDNIITFIRYEAELEDHRESIMERSIGPRLKTLIDSDPELSKKSRVSVLIHQGAGHALLFPKLVDLARDTEASVELASGDNPLEFDHFDRLATAFRLGTTLSKQEKRELAMRALARVGLKLNAMDWVIKEEDYHNGKIVLPSADTMVDRFSEASIRAFHSLVVQAEAKRKLR